MSAQPKATTNRVERWILGALAPVLLFLTGFLLGGIWGRLTIPAGSGLAGAGTAAIQALLAGVVAATVGVVLVTRSGTRGLRRLAGASVALFAVAWVALRLTPRPTLEVSAPGPPAVYQPAFRFSLMEDPHQPPSPDDPLDLPFRRLEVSTPSRNLRAQPADSATMCTAALPARPRLYGLCAVATAVVARCASGECGGSECVDCPPYRLSFALDGEERRSWDVSGTFLVSTEEGRTLVAEAERLFAEAPPWSSCGS